MKKCVFMGLLLSCIFLSGFSVAGNINDDLNIVKNGVVVCGKGDIRIRNINESVRLYTQKIELYDRLGTVLYDSSVDGFSSDFKRTLYGKQSTYLRESSVDALSLEGEGGPHQTWIYFRNLQPDAWEPARGLPPKMGGVKKHTNDQGNTTGFHSFGCTYQRAK